VFLNCVEKLYGMARWDLQFRQKVRRCSTLSIPLKSLVPQPYEPRPRRLVEYSVRTRITISVPTSPSVTPYVSAACLNSVITCSNPPTNMNNTSYARPSDYSNLFEGARIMFNSSSSSDSSSDSEDNRVSMTNSNAGGDVVGTVEPGPFVARRPRTAGTSGTQSRAAPYVLDRPGTHSRVENRENFRGYY